MLSRTSVAGGVHSKMRGLHKAGNPREIRSLRQAGSPRAYVKQDLCRRGCALKNEGPYIKQKLLERKKVFIKQGVPGPMRTGDSLLCKGIWRLDKSLLFNDFWRSVASPPATEVWFRCAPPHVASLINGNGVQGRRALPLMSGGAAAASSCVAGPLSPGVRTQK